MINILSEEQLNNLSWEELHAYYHKLNTHKWENMSFQEKDKDILSGQDFYANKRGIEGINLEEVLNIINDPNSSTEKWNFFLDVDFANRNISRKNTVQVGEPFTFFWRTKSPFSQWHLSKFIATTCMNEGISDLSEVKKKHILQDLFPLDVQEYSSAEQFMMYHKAIIFLDREIAQKIMQTKDVRKIKELGRQIKNFDEYIWKYFRSKVVYEGNKAKFTQNQNLQEALFNTTGTTLVEAAPDDTIWGIGLDESDTRALKRETWLGKNLLGEILTQIRMELMDKY